MTANEINRRLDSICEQTRNPSLLNSLHACRPGHPWNAGEGDHFANAAFIAYGRINPEDIEWLGRMSKRPTP